MLQSFEFASGAFGFLLGTRHVAFDSDEVLIDLRQLVLERRSFTEQPKNLLAGRFHRAFAVAEHALQRFTFFVLCGESGAGGFRLLFQFA